MLLGCAQDAVMNRQLIPVGRTTLRDVKLIRTSMNPKLNLAKCLHDHSAETSIARSILVERGAARTYSVTLLRQRDGGLCPWDDQGHLVRRCMATHDCSRFYCGVTLDTSADPGGSNSVVESQLPKLLVAGSIPVSRSKTPSISCRLIYRP